MAKKKKKKTVEIAYIENRGGERFLQLYKSVFCPRNFIYYTSITSIQFRELCRKRNLELQLKSSFNIVHRTLYKKKIIRFGLLRPKVLSDIVDY